MTRQDTKGDGKENAGTDINITTKQNRPHLNKHLNLPRPLILTRLRDRTEILISFCLKIVTTCDFLNALAEQVVLAIIIAVLASSPGLVGQIGIGQRWGNFCQLFTSNERVDLLRQAKVCVLELFGLGNRSSHTAITVRNQAYSKQRLTK